MRSWLILAWVVGLGACGRADEPAGPSCPVWFPDGDGDGYGDAASEGVEACDAPDAHVGNAYDCDDGDADIHPMGQERCDPDDRDEDCDGLVENDDPNALGRTEDGFRDADGDGHATFEHAVICPDTPGWLDEPGFDCDDADPAVFPHADDPVDGVDTNCDHFDGPGLYDGFERDGPDPATWSQVGGEAVEGVTPGRGFYSLVVNRSTYLESVTLDTSACDAVAWHLLVHCTDPDLTEPLLFEYWDGDAWQTLDAWLSDGAGHWTHRWGRVADPSASHADFRVRVHMPDPPLDWGAHYLIDELMVGCVVESDDDAVPDGVDCAPADPLHWFDCGECVDVDGDGYGVGCDLGRDCDDADASVHPLAPDPEGDDLDTDCTGVDGPELFDGFDAEPADTLWSPLVRASVSLGDVASPPYSLLIQGEGRAVAPPLDLSGCDGGVWWEYQGLSTSPRPDASLALEWEGLDGWVTADEWPLPDGPPAFARRWGVIDDPDAARHGARLRLRAHRWSWRVDDFGVACLVDADGDRVHDPRDCDPADPLHWFDCGLCIDGDGDGYGTDCDLGDDCDDARADVHPGAPDTVHDGLDADCEGFDGPWLMTDDFEPGGPDPALWALVDDDVDVVAPGWEPRVFLSFDGGGVAEAAPVDASSCHAVGWWIVGNLPTNGGGELSVEYWDGAGWTRVDTWAIPPYAYPWHEHVGMTSDAGALRPDLRIRLRGPSPGGMLYVDAFTLGCVEP